MRRPPLGPEEAREWRAGARRELRRSRRFLLALIADMDDAALDWRPRRPGAGCARWHLGRAALVERELLAMVVTGLETDRPDRDQPFASHRRADATLALPDLDALRTSLREIRRLSEALVAAGRPEEIAEVVLDVVNAEYAEAGEIARLRHDMGRSPVREPRGALLELEEDGESAARLRLVGWQPRRRHARPRRTEAEIVSLAEHRAERADELIETGHHLASAGDLRTALTCFERSASLHRTAEAVTYQGWMHALLGSPSRAEELCREAIRLDPDFGNPYNDIGTFCLQRREISEAIDWFERAKRAARYEPRHFPYLNLGRLYLSLGRTEEALREFEGALGVAPGNEEARVAVEQLRAQLEGD